MQMLYCAIQINAPITSRRKDRDFPIAISQKEIISDMSGVPSKDGVIGAALLPHVIVTLRL